MRFLLIILLLSGCAAYERAHFPLPAYRRALDHADGLVESRYGMNPAENMAGSMASAIVASGLSVVGNSDVFAKDFLSGRCLCRRSLEESLEFPCANVTVTLVDAEGKEVGRLSTGDGEFVFQVKREERYGVRIVSTKYYLLSEPRLHHGDDVVLHLVQK